ncbi:MAG: aminoglycoside phosphotransferase [Gammaproteobacteria bacterium]|nr:MAG: aminoglycoside phosphotransferase [Gammaproteobacteria bacterium]
MNGNLPVLIAALLRTLPGARLIETHISWVLLGGGFAYKLKKPLDLGFLDFSTLEKRRRACEEEIRLNRRLAPEVYLGVVPVTGSLEAPRFEGEGPVVEWAVKMRAFPADATLDRADRLQEEQIDAIAQRIALFHAAIALAPEGSAFGLPDQVRRPVTQNFVQIRALEPPPEVLALLDRLEAWVLAEGRRLDAHFARRRAQGHVRECHGDLHLGNIAWVDGRPLIFDAIEFNPALRFVDVVNEIAFLAMDLFHRGEDRLAWRFLNRYLEYAGDYDGLEALRYYMVYRAMVRAKVSAIRAGQQGASGDGFAECLDYLGLALRLSEPMHPALLLMHGVSGSGKTVLSQWLLEDLGAIRLRSDVERKRLFGLGPLDRSEQIPGGIYSAEASERTRDRLLQLAAKLLEGEFRVIVDATFLDASWRQPFEALAETRGLGWCIVSPAVPESVLRQRVAQRARAGRDASEADLAVLEQQLGHRQPLSEEERLHGVEPSMDTDRETLARRVAGCLSREPAVKTGRGER